jgi:hypothetical protein
MVIGDERYVKRAEEALMALARLSEDQDVRRKHVKAAQMTRGGENVINFSAFKRDLFGSPYALDVSTSRDPKFKAQIARNTNYVWEKVNAMIFRPDDYRTTEYRSHFLTKYREGDMEYMVLFKDSWAYMASWAPELKSIGRPLLMTQMKILPYMEQMEMPEVRGGRASDEMSAAFRMGAVQDMAEAVRLRPRNVSIKKAFGNWGATQLNIGVAGFGAVDPFMWDSYLRKWLTAADGGTVDPMWSKKIHEMREQLRWADELDDPNEAVNYEASEMLQRMRQFALYAGELVERYGAVEAVAGIGIDDAAAVDIRPDADALEGDDRVTDKCYGVYSGWCGGPTALVGGSFSGRIGGRLTEFIRRVDAAIAGNVANAAEVRDDIKKLHEEFREIAEAFYSHVGGSLQLVAAERMLRDVVPDSQLEDRHKELSGIGSELALLQGHMEFLKPEEAHVTARDFKYSFTSRELEISGQKANVMMVRLKENGKKSNYVTSLPWYRNPALWPPRFY